jgi:hypothetical protein
MANTETKQTFGLETIEVIHEALKTTEEFLNGLPSAVDIVHYSLKVSIDGCTVGIVEIQDDFPTFIANGDWNGYQVIGMGE